MGAAAAGTAAAAGATAGAAVGESDAEAMRSKYSGLLTSFYDEQGHPEKKAKVPAIVDFYVVKPRRAMTRRDSLRQLNEELARTYGADLGAAHGGTSERAPGASANGGGGGGGGGGLGSDDDDGESGVFSGEEERPRDNVRDDGDFTVFPIRNLDTGEVFGTFAELYAAEEAKE